SIAVQAADGAPLCRTVISDISERVRAEKELRRVNRALRLLSECSHTLIHAADEDALLHAICRNAVEIGDYRLAWLVMAAANLAVFPVALKIRPPQGQS
ncbi:MAG: hypothetical protein MUO68_01865, partial [Desulfobacteraceae bacterium]|nr:hypothetical protein [Desulfobacteraceae bacterium]